MISIPRGDAARRFYAHRHEQESGRAGEQGKRRASEEYRRAYNPLFSCSPVPLLLHKLRIVLLEDDRAASAESSAASTCLALMVALVVASSAGPARGQAPDSIPWAALEERPADGGLLPAYRDVVERPLEYFGISIWSGPEQGGGYMGALARPSTIEAGGVNVFAETDVVERRDDYQALVDLGVNFLPFTHTLFSPTDDQPGFYTYDRVKRVIGFLEKRGIAASAYFGLANHPGFPIYTLDYAREDPTRFQRDAGARPVYRVFPPGKVLNPVLTWEHPDLALGATRSAVYHAEDWRGFSNIPFWCLMGEILFAGSEGDFSEAHRRHFAAWLRRRYGTAEAWAGAWHLDRTKDFAEAPTPTGVASSNPGPARLDAARFRRESMAELYRAVRTAVRQADPDRLAFGLFHGSADQPRQLVEMGVHPDRIATMTDGIASSHILWPNTGDPRNLVNLALFRSFGRPVVVPIFGLEQDKVINDFTSANYRVERMGRRVYEHMGMGVWALAVGYWKVWGWTLAHDEDAKEEIARLAAQLKRLEPDSHLMQPVPCPVGLVITADDAALLGMPGQYQALYAAALARGLPTEFVYEERLLSNRPPVPPVLVLAGRNAPSEAGLGRLLSHVEQGGAVLFYPTGEEDWLPADLAENERVGRVEVHASPSTHTLVDWLARQAGPDAIPVRYSGHDHGLETFPLGDGVNAMVIAVNTTDQAIEDAEIEVAEHLVAGPARWHARVGQQVSIEKSRVRLSLQRHGVAVLFGEMVVPDTWDLRGERARLDRELTPREAEGFDVTAPRRVLSAARVHLDTGRRAKALASLLHVRRTLLARLETEATGDLLRARVRLAELGAPLPDNAEVELRLPDHGKVRVELDRIGGSEWAGELARGGQLAVYDYQAARYHPDPGPIAVQAEVRAGARAGASPVVIWPALARDHSDRASQEQARED